MVVGAVLGLVQRRGHRPVQAAHPDRHARHAEHLQGRPHLLHRLASTSPPRTCPSSITAALRGRTSGRARRRVPALHDRPGGRRGRAHRTDASEDDLRPQHLRDRRRHGGGAARGHPRRADPGVAVRAGRRARGLRRHGATSSSAATRTRRASSAPSSTSSPPSSSAVPRSSAVAARCSAPSSVSSSSSSSTTTSCSSGSRAPGSAPQWECCSSARRRRPGARPRPRPRKRHRHRAEGGRGMSEPSGGSCGNSTSGSRPAWSRRAGADPRADGVGAHGAAARRDVHLLRDPASPGVFLNPVNLQNIGLVAPEIGLLSLAVMMAMLTGGIDLSVVAIANGTAITVSTALHGGRQLTGSGGGRLDDALDPPRGCCSRCLRSARSTACSSASWGLPRSLQPSAPCSSTTGSRWCGPGGVTVSGAPSGLTSMGTATVLGVPVLLMILIVCCRALWRC